jgi:hypothetical protein
MFTIGLLVGAAMGVIHGYFPTIGVTFTLVGLYIGTMNLDMGLGYLVAESTVSGIGKVIGEGVGGLNAVHNPYFASRGLQGSLEQRVEGAKDGLYQYMISKGVAVMGGIGLVMFGLPYMTVKPGEAIVLCSGGVGVLLISWLVFTVKDKLAFFVIVGSTVGAAIITIKAGGIAPMYSLFTAIFSIGGLLVDRSKTIVKGKKWVMVTKEKEPLDASWAMFAGACSAFLIGIPNTIMLSLSATDEVAKTERTLYVEGCISAGVSEGMGLVLFLVAFGSRDALSSTMSLLVDGLDVGQSLVILAASLILMWFTFMNLSEKWIYHHLLGKMTGENKWVKRISIAVSFATMVLISGPWLSILLVIMGVFLQKAVIRHYVPEETILAMLCVLPFILFWMG